MSIYSFLADATVTVHVAYVLFVVMGLFLVVIGGLLKWRWIRNRWFRYTHLTMIGVVVIESLLSITCPLTTLEAYWRSQAGQAVEDSSFMGRLAHNLLFYDLSPEFFTVCYCSFGAVVLLSFVFFPPTK